MSTVKRETTILDARADDTIPFAESEELVRNSGLSSAALVAVGDEHRLADPVSLKALLDAEGAVAKRVGRTASSGGLANVTI